MCFSPVVEQEKLTLHRNPTSSLFNNQEDVVRC
jgi:hypothetical protein